MSDTTSFLSLGLVVLYVPGLLLLLACRVRSVRVLLGVAPVATLGLLQVAALLAAGTPVHGIVYRGHRYDTGMPLGYLQAVVQLAVKRPDLGAEFRQWLSEFVATESGGAQG